MVYELERVLRVCTFYVMESYLFLQWVLYMVVRSLVSCMVRLILKLGKR